MKRYAHNAFFGLFFLLSVFFTTATIFAQTPAPQATPVEIKLAPEKFDAFVGQYDDTENGQIFSFLRESDKFFMRVTNYVNLEIAASAENKFFPKNFRAEIEFVSENGKVTTMLWRQNGGEIRMKRIADQPEKDTRVSFKRTETMIPMRDGVKLFTVIFTPENQSENLPILMERSPYGIKGTDSNGLNRGEAELVKDGYIFVYQDIRGRHDSEGEFVMARPPRDKKNAKSIDESTDTNDTINYLLKNVPRNNGRVGI